MAIDLRFNPYVITSFRTYSAATNFAVNIYDNNLGLIVGEPSGSKSSSYGSIILLELNFPNQN